jgi:hypothetical protein
MDSTGFFVGGSANLGKGVETVYEVKKMSIGRLHWACRWLNDDLQKHLEQLNMGAIPCVGGGKLF